MEDKQKATKRQMEILVMISDSIRERGFPPTRAEIANHFSFKSKNAATDHIKALAKKDYLDLFIDTSRGIKITVKGHQALSNTEDT